MKGITIVLVVYIIYMLNFYKTTISIAHPLTYFDNDILYHPIENTEEPRNMICKLGNDGAWIIAIIVIIRGILLYTKSDLVSRSTLKLISKIMLYTVFLLTFLNFNAMLLI